MDKLGEITGFWDATEPDVTFTPTGPFRRVANRLFYGPVSNSWDGGVRMLQFWTQPITDRRVARRISRQTGMHFTKRGHEYRFSGEPRG